MTVSTRPLLAVLAVLVLVFPACRQKPATPEVAPDTEGADAADVNARFGMPAPAHDNPQDREAYLIQRSQYTLSYNAKKHTPNWVSWRLLKSDLGKASRGPFQPDPLLPQALGRVTSHVYDGSGFDRGHQCPAADRSARQEDCDATFFMTNIVPQAPQLNQKPWERLESYCRTLAKEGHELQIVCGPHGVGGTGKDGQREEIGQGRLKVAVPKQCWKVVLVLSHEGAKPRRNTRVIAVVMPNRQDIGLNWARYRVSVNDVEKLTGLHFFSTLPAELAAALKEAPDDVEVREPKQREGRP